MTATAYSPDGTHVAIAAEQDRTYLPRRGPSGGRCWGAGADPVLAFSPDGGHRFRAATTRPCTALVRGQRGAAGILEDHKGSVQAIAYGRNDILASADSGEDVIHIWDVGTKTLKGTLEGHDNNIVALAFSANSTRLASGSFDKTILLWDMNAMKELSRLEGHTKVVNGVAFTPDGTRLVSCSGDSTVRVWDVVTRQELLKLDGGMRDVSRIAVASRDGRRIACLGHDRIVRIWEADIPKKKPAGPQ